MPDPTNAELNSRITDLAVTVDKLHRDIETWQPAIADLNHRLPVVEAEVESLKQSSGWWAGLETWLGNHPGIAHSLNALFSAATGFAIAYMTLHTPVQPAPTPQVQVKPDESPKGSVKDGKGP